MVSSDGVDQRLLKKITGLEKVEEQCRHVLSNTMLKSLLADRLTEMISGCLQIQPSFQGKSISEEDRPILKPFPTDRIPVYNNIELHGSIHDHDTRLCRYAAILLKEVDLGQFSVNLNAFFDITTRLSYLAADVEIKF
jgi:hypothetical protein